MGSRRFKRAAPILFRVFASSYPYFIILHIWVLQKKEMGLKDKGLL